MRKLLIAIACLYYVSEAQIPVYEPIDSTRRILLSDSGFVKQFLIQGLLLNKWRDLYRTVTIEALEAFQDSSIFSGNATEVTVRLVKCRPWWQFGYAIRKQGSPGLTDLISYWAMNDSVTFYRIAGATQNLKFNYWRIK